MLPQNMTNKKRKAVLKLQFWGFAFRVFKIAIYLVTAKTLYSNVEPSTGVGNWYLQCRVSNSHAKTELSLKQLRMVLLNGRKNT